jgi:predicted glycosyltransferase
MNREAAALGVPVYSIFRGRIGAVDHYLARAGRLTLIEKKEEVRTKLRLTRRIRPAHQPGGSRASLETIVEHLIVIAEGIVGREGALAASADSGRR